jgi:DNA-binding beta-propeller fold protein YncE
MTWRTDRGVRAHLVILTVTLGAMGFWVAVAAQAPSTAAAPRYKYDPDWPKPLPNKWKMGGVIGLGITSDDSVWVYHRPTDLTSLELEAEVGVSDCCVRPPSMIHIGKDGSVLGSFDAPQGHGMDVDDRGFAYLGQDTVRKYDTRSGKLVGEIPRIAERVGGGPNQAATIAPRTAGQGSPAPITRFLLPPNGPGYNPVALEAAEMTKLSGFYAKYPPSTPMMVGTTEEVRVDEAHNEIYVAENYLGGRVLVFDLTTLQFKRGWGAYGKKLADITTNPADRHWVGSTPPKEFQSHLTVAISRDGFVYAADRAAERVQAFTREGKFVKEYVMAAPGTKRDERTGSRGAAGGVTFSADSAQKYLYVSDMKNNTIWFVDRASGAVVGRYGSMGDAGGQFFGLELAVTDSRGNIYTGEVFAGMRVQRLVPSDSPRGKLLEQLSQLAP